MKGLTFWALFVTASLLMPSRSLAQETSPSAAPPQAEVVSVTKSSLTLHVPKWTPRGQQRNSGLVVRYSWEDVDAPADALRSATVRDAGTHWVVLFPDRPEIGQKALLQYVYVYELNEAARAKLRGLAESLISSVIDTVVAALAKADAAAQAKSAPEAREAERARAFSKALVELYPTRIAPQVALLGSFYTSQGEVASSALLKQLGWKPLADGTWTRELEGMEQLAELEALAKFERSARAAKQEQADKLAPADASDSACSKAVEAATKTSSVELGLAVVDLCAEAYAAQAAGEGAAVVALRQASAAFAHASYEKNAEMAAAALPLWSGVGALAQGVQAMEQGGALSLAYRRILLGLQTLLAAKATALKRAKIDALTKLIVQQRFELKQSQPARAVLELEPTRRRFDAVTGFVYVLGLDDLVMPSMLAICPWGCLMSDEGTADYGDTEHTISFDLGVKAATLDGDVDPRHDGQLGVLVGASWNPIDVVRASIGLYAFENAQTKDWNATAYGGVTINVLHAGELLGIFGVSAAPKAEIKPTTQSAP